MTWKHQLRAAIQKLLGLNLMVHQIGDLKAQLELLQKELEFTRRDLLGADRLIRNTSVVLVSSAGPARESVDHILPKGTIRDNTRWPRLGVWAEEQFGRKVRFLDLGCAGGGLVYDMLSLGHDAIGVEGSDLSAHYTRAEWGTIRERLFVADITKDFDLQDTESEGRVLFDFITAWEVLEHIPEEKIDGLFANIIRHLAVGGIFAASVATYEDSDATTGLRWHQTVQSKGWWLAKIRQIAPEFVEIKDGWKSKDFPRGSGNPNIPWDWDAEENPERGFHLVLRRR